MTEKLAWIQQGNIYRASILDMQAVVEKFGSKFQPSIRDEFGSILERAVVTFGDVDSAEEWVLFNVIDIEQLAHQKIAKQRRLKTLDAAADFIRNRVHFSHLERLTRIRNWALIRRDDIESLRIPHKESFQPLEWTEVDTKTFSAMTPQGKAVIFEKGITAHEAWIEHESGAKYKSLDSFIDFLEAEYWLQKAVNQLNDPHVNEVNLDCIHFTLEICRRFSPQDADPLDMARLDYLEGLLGEVLP